MKGLARLALFLPLVSAFAFPRPESQQVLHTASLDNSDAEIYHLLAVHNDDPVEVMRLVDPVHAADLEEPRLLQVFGFDPVWMTEGDKLRLRMQGLSFMDLTGREDLSKSRVASQQDPTWPEVRHQERVKEVIKGLNINEMKYNLGNLTSLYNRYYRSENGEKASTWVHDKVREIVADAPSHVRVSIESFPHSYPQSSIIARFEPATLLNDQARIVVGAHLDSVNQIFPYLRAPGADDDGSGTVTTLEAFRALVHAGFTPELPVEFHWYAAEEGGLLGSQDVVKEYVKQQKQVAAMIQFDMTISGQHKQHEDAGWLWIPYTLASLNTGDQSFGKVMDPVTIGITARFVNKLSSRAKGWIVGVEDCRDGYNVPHRSSPDLSTGRTYPD